MIKTCPICNKEFETNYPNKKYCNIECNREQTRQADRLRKYKERQIIKKKQSAEEMERRRLRDEKIEEASKERQKEEKEDLKKRLLEGDPKAIMKVNNNSSLEYWEAYKEDFMQEYYNKNYIRYINDISVYDEDFPNKVIDSIRINGRIYSKLIKNKK